MIERVGQIKGTEPFDFRSFACPDDPFTYLFDEWVDYYHTKYALCRALNPRSILEIGVRYGYSAISFLTACPRARYLGLDNDSGTYGGAQGAIAWARRITNGYAAEFRVSNSQTLSALPGDRYDLVHIDGQQDGDGTFHDLELAVHQATWILLDGYFHSTANLLSATYFLEKYRLLIEGAYVFPGYAGDLLMKVREPEVRLARDDAQLQGAYDGVYYCRDCSGHDAFKRTGGRMLQDGPRRALYYLARPTLGTRVLDVGSGRGEFAFACVAAGADVVGVDYSEAAIGIARTAYRSELGSRLKFVHADILQFEPDEKLDVIAMADFVEHVAPERLDRALGRCRRWLQASGHLLIHTWPNRPVYQYQHAKRRRMAAAAGLYLPKNPRTYYEDVMHINEQTPARLRKALQQHFAHVVVWTAGPSDALGSLRAGISRRQVTTFDSIYAVASMAPVDRAFVREALTQPALQPASVRGVRVDVLAVEHAACAGGRVQARVRVSNPSQCRLASLPPFPVHCTYHWMSGERVVVFDGLRTAFWPALSGDAAQVVEMEIHAPSEPGTYELVVTLVQEEQFWFDAAVPGCAATAIVEVR